MTYPTSPTSAGYRTARSAGSTPNGPTMSEPGLFDEPQPMLYPVLTDRYAGMGRDARRTAKALDLLLSGVHPLTRLPLHTDAAPTNDRAAAGLRCGTCTFRVSTSGWPKCARATHQGGSEASDCRRWWPACRLHQDTPN